MFLKGLHFAAQEKAEGPWRSWRTKPNSHADNIFWFVSDRHHNQTSPNQKVTPTPVTALSVGPRWLSLFLSQITPTSLRFLQPFRASLGPAFFFLQVPHDVSRLWHLSPATSLILRLLPLSSVSFSNYISLFPTLFLLPTPLRVTYGRE